MTSIVGILGTGVVARALSTRLLGLGYTVTLGTRDVATTLGNDQPNQYGGPPFREWHRQNPNVALVTFREAPAPYVSSGRAGQARWTR